MVNCVKCSREIKEAETGDMLASNGTNEVVIKSKKSSFR